MATCYARSITWNTPTANISHKLRVRFANRRFDLFFPDRTQNYTKTDFQIPLPGGMAKQHPSQSPSRFHVHGSQGRSILSFGQPSNRHKSDAVRTKANVRLLSVPLYRVSDFRGPLSGPGELQGPIQKNRKPRFMYFLNLSLHGLLFSLCMSFSGQTLDSNIMIHRNTRHVFLAFMRLHQEA